MNTTQRLSVLVCALTMSTVACNRADDAPSLDPHEMLTVDLTMDQQILADDDLDAVVMISVNSAETPVGERASVSLALVFDTSGSMEGNKIDNAKEAAHGLVNSLAVGDSLTLIAYSETAEALLENYRVGVDRSEAHQAVNDLEARGNTCTSCGLDLAYLLFQRPDVEPIRRVVLLSDGHANRGLQGEDHLRSLASNANAMWQVDTATIGLGRLHNEAVMAAVAEGGAATYYFLHNSNHLATVLERELRSLHSTIVTDLVLRIQPGDGVVFTGTENTGAYWDGPDLIFTMGQMSLGETRELIVSMQLPHGNMGRAVFAQAEFADIMGARYTMEESVRVERSQDTVRIESSANQRVIERYMELQAAERIVEAMYYFENDSRDDAMQVLTDAAAEMDGFASMFESASMRQQAEELRTIATDFEEPEYYGDEASTQPAPAQERGEIILNRARSSEIRSGVPSEETYHQPQMYDMSEIE